MKMAIHEGRIPEELVNQVKDIDETGEIVTYLNDPFTFTTGIVSNKNNEILACGLIRVVNELKVVIKSDIGTYAKTVALRLLLEEANKRMQCNEAIALITNGGDHYVNILKQHFKFYEDHGIFLRLEVEHGREQGQTTGSIRKSL